MKLLDKLRSKIGLQILFDYINIIDTIKFAKDNGFNNLELNLNNINFYQQLNNSKERKRIRESANEANVNLLFHSPEGLSFFVPDEKIRAATLDALKRIIDWALEIKIERVTIHLGTDMFFGTTGKRVPTYEVYPDYFKHSITEVLTNIKKIAKDKTYACIENVGGFRYPFVMEIIDKTLGDNLALTMDIGHIHRFQGEAREKEYEFFKDHLKYIKNCHIHDNNSEWDQHNIIGEGKIDFIPYFKMLADTDSYLIFEVRPKESAVECLKRFNEILVPKLADLES